MKKNSWILGVAGLVLGAALSWIFIPKSKTCEDPVRCMQLKMIQCYTKAVHDQPVHCNEIEFTPYVSGARPDYPRCPSDAVSHGPTLKFGDPGCPGGDTTGCGARFMQKADTGKSDDFKFFTFGEMDSKSYTVVFIMEVQ